MKYDTDGRIDQDLPCLKCGYNLRTLLDDGQCPECGAGIMELAQMGWLCQHDPVWLRKLARSTVWIGAGMIGCILLLSLALRSWWRWSPPAGGIVVAVLLLAVVSGTGAGVIGFWQITEPPRDGDLRGSRARRIARRAMTAAGLLFTGLPCTSGLATGLLIACGIACFGVSGWATLAYAAALAARIPDARLVKQVRIVAWVFVLCVASLCVGVLMRAAEQQMAGLDPIGTTIVVIAIAVLLLLDIWTIPLLVWYRRRFREAAAMSQRGENGQGR